MSPKKFWIYYNSNVAWLLVQIFLCIFQNVLKELNYLLFLGRIDRAHLAGGPAASSGGSDLQLRPHATLRHRLTFE